MGLWDWGLKAQLQVNIIEWQNEIGNTIGKLPSISFYFLDEYPHDDSNELQFIDW